MTGRELHSPSVGFMWRQSTAVTMAVLHHISCYVITIGLLLSIAASGTNTVNLSSLFIDVSCRKNEVEYRCQTVRGFYYLWVFFKEIRFLSNNLTKHTWIDKINNSLLFTTKWRFKLGLSSFSISLYVQAFIAAIAVLHQRIRLPSCCYFHSLQPHEINTSKTKHCL